MRYLLILLLILLQPALLTANTVIHAVRTGNINTVKRAIGAAADATAAINATDSVGRNALHHAAIIGKIDIVEYLLAHAAYPKQKDSNKKVPFQLAVEPKMTIERARVASVLLHATKGVFGRDTKGWTALHWAILAKDRQLIDRWLDEGATLLRYGPMFQRQHPIEVAFLVKDTQLIDYLVNRYKEWKGQTALWTAINADLYELVEALLNRGYNPANIEGHVSNQSLTRAAVNKGNPKMLELLLEHGAPTDDQQPLIEAARGRKHDLVKLLVDYGTDLKMTSAHDWYALIVTAFRSEDKDLFAKIIAATVSNNSYFQVLPAFTRAHTKANTEFVEIIDALLEHDVDINVRENGNDHTALYYAVKSRYADIVSALISRGADVEMRINGHTPLMLAASIGAADVVSTLLKNGADVHATIVENDEERDALYFARQALEREEKNNSYKSALVPQYKRIIELLGGTY